MGSLKSLWTSIVFLSVTFVIASPSQSWSASPSSCEFQFLNEDVQVNELATFAGKQSARRLAFKIMDQRRVKSVGLGVSPLTHELVMEVHVRSNVDLTEFPNVFEGYPVRYVRDDLTAQWQQGHTRR